jgi:hypothetical protein
MPQIGDIWQCRTDFYRTTLFVLAIEEGKGYIQIKALTLHSKPKKGARIPTTKEYWNFIPNCKVLSCGVWRKL